MRFIQFSSTLLLSLLSLPLKAQTQPPAGTEKPHLDAILQRNNPTPAPDLTSDGTVDVRDLVVFLNGQPVSASFGSAESIVFHSQGGVILPIYFSKPVTGTVAFDFGGTAEAGAGKDFTISPSTITLNGDTSAQLNIQFEPWRGIGGEKVVRLSLNRNPAEIPSNGTFPSHLLRIRQFDGGEFVGTLRFSPASGLPAQAVRIGLSSDGSAVCAFPEGGTLLGNMVAIGWAPGIQGFPSFPENTEVEFSGASLGRTSPLTGSLSFTRLAEPYDANVQAFVDGFASGNKPAMYRVSLSFSDLFAAGAAFIGVEQNTAAIIYNGELAIQPVTYSASAQ